MAEVGWLVLGFIFFYGFWQVVLAELVKARHKEDEDGE